MKAGKEHRVPLSKRAIAILALVQPLNTIESESAFVFPGAKGKGLSGMAMAMLMRRIGRSETVHGFRSSFRDWAAEQTAFAHEVCEMALAHTIGNKAEAAYRRGDLLEKRLKLMEAWASYCGSKGLPGAVVSPIRGSSAAR